jgi:hypothetical protein
MHDRFMHQLFYHNNNCLDSNVVIYTQEAIHILREMSSFHTMSRPGTVARKARPHIHIKEHLDPSWQTGQCLLERKAKGNHAMHRSLWFFQSPDQHWSASALLKIVVVTVMIVALAAVISLPTHTVSARSASGFTSGAIVTPSPDTSTEGH